MKKLAVLLAVAVSAVAASAAIGSSKSVAATGHTSLGTVLVNSKGLTLYLYEGDSGKKLGCSGSCLSNWPPLTGTGVAKGGAKASDLGTVKRGSGTQVTYNGHPVYTFAGDSKAGQVNGEGIVLAGKTWYAVGPAGSAMIASTKTTSSSSSSSGGSGGAGW
jgi:predicted lipoprotein with Yx(FWY)xxD motif